MTPVYVSRINQLDALQLDEEIYGMLSRKSRDIFRLLSPGVVEKYTPEINASLRTIIWLFSLGMGQGESSFGQKLLDLTYVELTRTKSIIFGILSILPKYLEEKYIDPNRLAITLHEKRLRRSLETIFSTISLLSFLNLLVFLNRGSQPMLLERFLGISSRHIVSKKPRTIGYSYMTRELLWHGLMELFTVSLPMVNFHYLKRYIIDAFTKKKKNHDICSIKPNMSQTTLCPYCKETPVLPRHAGCSHIYCYYCISAHFKLTESFNCFGCALELHSKDMKIYSVMPSNYT